MEGLFRRRYAIGTEDAERRPAAPQNTRLICDKPDPGHTDHAHEAGKVRGILCFNCNQGLGNFPGDVHLPVRAANDLMRGSSWSGKGLEGIQVGTGQLAPA
jgi:Recombination endonuclease VII